MEVSSAHTRMFRQFFSANRPFDRNASAIKSETCDFNRAPEFRGETSVMMGRRRQAFGAPFENPNRCLKKDQVGFDRGV